MKIMTIKQQLLGCVFFISALLVCGLIYLSGLSGGFLLDDAQHLSLLNSRGGVTTIDTVLSFVLGNHSGALGRPLSMLSFLLNDQAFPGSVSDYRLTNVLIHGLCGIAIFVFTRRLLMLLNKTEQEACWLALIVMAWWLLAPINVSTTLYIIQRMTQLSALFTLLGLIFYLKGREQIIQGVVSGWGWVVAGLFVCGGLATLSKENGVLIFVFAAAIESLITSVRGERSPQGIRWLLLLPILAITAYFFFSWDSLAIRYQYRDFSAYERLLTQSRVLWDYSFKALIPFFGKLGLIHDDVSISRGLFLSWQTLLAVIAHMVVAIFSWSKRKQWPLLWFAVIWFYGGHLLESTVIPLELYYEHRNYLPVLGIFIAVVASLWHVPKYTVLSRALVVLLIILAGVSSSRQALLWGNPQVQIKRWAYEHPNSIRAQTDLAGLLLQSQQYRQAQQQLELIRERWPNQLHLDLLLYKGQCLGYFSSNITLDGIIEKQSRAAYSGHLRAVVDMMMNLYRNQSCARLKSRSMLALLEGFVGLPKSRHGFNAQVKFLMSEVYRNLGDFNGAMTSLDEAYQFRKLSVYRYTQAALFRSAGLNDEALKSINKALRVEERKWVLKRDNIQLYLQLKGQIERDLLEGE